MDNMRAHIILNRRVGRGAVRRDGGPGGLRLRRRAATEADDVHRDATTEHRGSDDLLTAGLGLDGLRAMARARVRRSRASHRRRTRRRALWNNWRGIADLGPLGGYGTLYGSTAGVPGREFSAEARSTARTQPHRVLVQVPDAFDTRKRCVVVTASSGSRGIYGAIAVAGAWGLPKGCAIAYTDKGAGTDIRSRPRPGVRRIGALHLRLTARGVA